MRDPNTNKRSPLFLSKKGAYCASNVRGDQLVT